MRLSRILTPLLLLALTGATCGSAARQKAPHAAQHPADGSGGPMPTTRDLPGYPLDQVLPSIARQIFAFSKDAFSYDGCPTPLDQCLKKARYRRHALRMLSLATHLAADGANNVQIDTLLNHYYASFPKSARKKIPVDRRMCEGPAKAPVTVVEFSDFECPYCGMARPLLEALVTHGGPVRLCFKPFPLARVHPHAVQAAEAGLYARDQGKFWAMHDQLFDHQEALGLDDLKRYAKDIGLDPQKMAQAIQSGRYLPELKASRALGHKLGVHGTPTVFLDGRLYRLPMDQADLTHSVNDELEWQKHGGKWAAR